MKKIFIKLPQEECDELERLFYEVQSRKDLVSYMISHQMVESNNEQYNKFFDEYQENYYLLDNYKKYISLRYVEPISENAHWAAEFDECGIYIILNEV